MGFCIVSALTESETRQLSAGFNSHEAAKEFIERRIEELLAQGARYVVVADSGAQAETRYDAASIADCVFVGAEDWRHALVRETA